MINVSKGLYEVITSKKIPLDEKLDAVQKFSWDVHHLDGELEGTVTPGEICQEDADLICEALKNGEVIVERDSAQ